jgi:hypothetical protein
VEKQEEREVRVRRRPDQAKAIVDESSLTLGISRLAGQDENLNNVIENYGKEAKSTDFC